MVISCNGAPQNSLILLGKVFELQKGRKWASSTITLMLRNAVNAGSLPSSICWMASSTGRLSSALMGRQLARSAIVVYSCSGKHSGCTSRNKGHFSPFVPPCAPQTAHGTWSCFTSAARSSTSFSSPTTKLPGAIRGSCRVIQPELCSSSAESPYGGTSTGSRTQAWVCAASLKSIDLMARSSRLRCRSSRRFEALAGSPSGGSV
mmetsp:Transcript_13040/g.41688  ORF Transcript_13040/g.41688 Transcript_13040/m.41688 type:complete len:205 (-) Transcript_13040:488-1102(-)